MQLIQVLYRNGRGGPVDDITLDELIQSQKITQFYRPSEDRWVDILIDPVRKGDHAPGAEGLKRRYADREEDSEQDAKSGGLFRGVFTRLTKHPPRNALSAEEWLELGFSALRNSDNDVAAARAFALSIRLNSQHQEAYLHRGLVYEALGNFQQATEDYGATIALDPSGKADGLVLGRPGVTEEARAGLRRAADQQRAFARTLLESPTELRDAMEAVTGRPRDEEKVGDAGTERPRGVAANLQRLIEKNAKEITQLEAQLQDVKHKHGILVETVRFLEEEVPTPH